MSVLGTAKGAWVIRVLSGFVTDDGATIQLCLVLERHSDSAPAQFRRLNVVLSELDLKVALARVMVADRIRDWIETTEADGVLDMILGS
ncbi:MAG: hypothetical protein LAO09_07475 [Acidobacteriia bacterium]|nr:hypothetical protein [Terriglobia bacterium]